MAEFFRVAGEVSRWIGFETRYAPVRKPFVRFGKKLPGIALRLTMAAWIVVVAIRIADRVVRSHRS